MLEKAIKCTLILLLLPFVVVVNIYEDFSLSQNNCDVISKGLRLIAYWLVIVCCVKYLWG